MTRLERIEKILEESARLGQQNQQAWQQNQQAIAGLVELHKHTQETVASLSEVVGRYVDAADARMKHMEANLDTLIRAITADHGNGKGKGRR